MALSGVLWYEDCLDVIKHYSRENKSTLSRISINAVSAQEFSLYSCGRSRALAWDENDKAESTWKHGQFIWKKRLIIFCGPATTERTSSPCNVLITKPLHRLGSLKCCHLLSFWQAMSFGITLIHVINTLLDAASRMRGEHVLFVLNRNDVYRCKERNGNFSCCSYYRPHYLLVLK